LGALLYGIIEAPNNGWTDPATIAGFLLGVLFLGAFAWWELHTDHPMLDFSFWKNPRFSAASAAIAFTFLALFGSLFVFTQYLQFVLGYSPLQTGVRLLAFAIPMVIIAPLSARFVQHVGTKVVVAGGMALTTLGLVLLSFVQADSSYPSFAWKMVLMASGLALTMAPATESIMGSLPLAKAGVGSAVNDTTRQVGGALGVAVLGSVYTSIYGSHIASALQGQPVPPEVLDVAKQSVGGALQAAAQIGGQVGQTLADAARSAFIDGFHASLLAGAGVTFVGVIVTAVWLPAHASDHDQELQHAEFLAEHAPHAELEPDPAP
jgi:Na+/melibiose symporter-like transporter